MTTATASAPSDTCAFCDKHGLPILPVRYAVARADIGHAPALPPRFGADLAAIPLPPDTAHYTLRLLRPGYLYVFQEHRQEWSAYVVNEQGYLCEFSIYAQVPPRVGKKIFGAICRAKSDPYLARCFTVSDAAHATTVWLGFSDVGWTRAVFDRHASPDYRQAHMQRIDLAQWRNGGLPPNMATFEALDQVAEFAADAAALQRETRDFVKRFFPDKRWQPEDFHGLDATSKQALSLLSPMIQDLLAGSFGTVADSGPVIAAAWAFAPHRLWVTGEETQAFTDWAYRAAQPWRPVIAGVPDPAGLAMELNGLAIQRSVEFTDDASRKWKMETAQWIAGLKKAIGHGAVLTQKQNTIDADVGLLATSSQGVLSMTPQGQQLLNQVRRADEAAIDARQDAIAEHAWDKHYRPHFQAGAWEQYLGLGTAPGVYAQQFDHYAQQILQPLDTAYLAWLQSDALHRYLTHNYDPQNAFSGEAYLDLATLLIHQASGRSAVFRYLAEQLQRDPRDTKAWLMRALALNHDPLIKAWSAVTLDGDATASAFSWTELAEQCFDAYKDLIVAGAHGELPQRFPGKLANVLYQLGGPLIQHLNQHIDRGFARLPVTRLHMGVLGLVAKAENPALEILPIRGEWRRQDATRTLAALVAHYAGGDPNGYRSGVRAALDRLPDSGEAYPFTGVVLLDTAQAQALMPGLSKTERRTAVSGMLTAEQIDDALQQSFGTLASLDAKLGVVQLLLSACTLSHAYHGMLTAKPDEAFDKDVDFAAGLSGVIGGAGSTVGRVLEQTEWGAAPLAKQFNFFAVDFTKQSDWFTGIGKLFGAAGGIMAGAMAIREGFELWDDHRALAIWSAIAGATSITIASITIFVVMDTEATGAAVLGTALSLAGIAVAIVLGVVAWLEPNAVQAWLEKSLYFGTARKPFRDIIEQSQQLHALEQGG